MCQENKSDNQPQDADVPPPNPAVASEKGPHFAILGVAAVAQFNSFSTSALKVLTLADHVAAFNLVRTNPQALQGMLIDLAVLAHGQASAAIMTSAGKPIQIGEIHARIATKYMEEARKCIETVNEMMGTSTSNREQTDKPVAATTAVQANVECVISPTVQCLMQAPVNEPTEDESLVRKLEANPHLSFAQIIGMPMDDDQSTDGESISV